MDSSHSVSAIDGAVSRDTISQHNQSVSLLTLLSEIWAAKFLIIAITFVFAVSSVYYALSLPNVYKSSVLLSPVSSENGGSLGGLANQFGGLASLAGISLNSSSGDKTNLAIQVIKSRKFIQDFIEKHDLLVPLMATKDWDMLNDQLVYNESLYDINTNTWVREAIPPRESKPSPWEAYKKFMERLIIAQNSETGMVTIELFHFSPIIAQQWLTLLVEEINLHIKQQEYKEAQDSIEYLREQLEKTNVASMQSIFYQLIEEQSKNMMLIEIRDEFVLKTIDPAVVPEEKAKPKRALLVILLTMLGGILATLFVIGRVYFRHQRTMQKTNNQMDLG